MQKFFKRRFLEPIKQLLTQGITPEKVALSLALGAVLAVFPVLGSTTLLCALAAVVLRLNLPALQLVNFLLYPVQLALVVPFMRAGAHLFRAPQLPFSLVQMLEMFRHDWSHSLSLLWVAALEAIVVWALCAPVVAAFLYFVLRPSLLRFAKTIRPAEAHAR